MCLKNLTGRPQQNLQREDSMFCFIHQSVSRLFEADLPSPGSNSRVGTGGEGRGTSELQAALDDHGIMNLQTAWDHHPRSGEFHCPISLRGCVSALSLVQLYVCCRQTQYIQLLFVAPSQDISSLHEK